MKYPRLDIDCSKIHHNAQRLISQLSLKNISVTPVTKVFLGNPIIAQVLVDAGAEMFADSRVENIQKMRQAGISVPKMLIRTPMLSQAASVVRCCEISLNTEVTVIQRLSNVAKQSNINHGIIIMVELGDLREGVMPNRVIAFIDKIISLPNIIIRGIGTNLACRYGVAPDDTKMELLSNLANEIEAIFGINLDVISGGNSASIHWALNYTGRTRVNNLRIGEAIYLGCEPLTKDKIEGLYTDAITLTAEVIESKIKPSLPCGVRGGNAFGEKENISNKGSVSQIILALGRQDVCVTGLSAPDGTKIVSSTSDHLIMETSGAPLLVGQKIDFNLDYSALLSCMSSAHIHHSYNSLSDLLPKKEINDTDDNSKTNHTIHQCYSERLSVKPDSN
ncbi:alanine/ornithine racemase family PLP-dependent enzyme [Vibrio tapetis]|uniref:Predicted amino acid racemase n=1 Tax=Vibrio tapetis subsp. tapetis TaxID=1671868 RepID=A0A2N8ZIB6_9VIBR|nr:alanine/ornithine racemase family PLP-dependent enzyme [Vibrio tapetis]SON51631.1 Predicted amino acid racemase [Vibrio tapetis subsp. tapetis]